MKTLIVEDHFVSRVLMQEFLKDYGVSHIAVNGKEAVEAARIAMDAGEPYDLICMDIMMPEMDGQTALKHIRDMEKAKGVVYPAGAKIVMTTALGDMKNACASFNSYCDAYLIKPIEPTKLLETLRQFGLVR